jgi:hypothetical protein
MIQAIRYEYVRILLIIWKILCYGNDFNISVCCSLSDISFSVLATCHLQKCFLVLWKDFLCDTEVFVRVMFLLCTCRIKLIEVLFIFSGSNQNNRQNAIESWQSTKGKTIFMWIIFMQLLVAHYMSNFTVEKCGCHTDVFMESVCTFCADHKNGAESFYHPQFFGDTWVYVI